jgi:transposase-like protein
MEAGGKKMKTKRYDQEFKEQIIRECQEVGNAALVARRHGLSKNTVHNWLKASRRNGSVVPLPKNKEQRLKEAERRLEELGRENDRLKRIVAEKELELAILKELRDLANPR